MHSFQKGMVTRSPRHSAPVECESPEKKSPPFLLEAGTPENKKGGRSNPPAWFALEMAIAKHKDKMASWPWWARVLHKIFIKCEVCAIINFRKGGR